MTSTDDEFFILREGWRLLGNDVHAELIARGWAVTDLDVDTSAPLELFWPPTAPIGFGNKPKTPDAAIPNRPERTFPRHTPWLRPTRITHTDDGWRVEYGEATAQSPDAPTVHADDQALLADLDRIEWWPMSPEEAGKIRDRRILGTLHNDAYNQFSLACGIETEPYLSRIRELDARIRWPELMAMEDRLTMADSRYPEWADSRYPEWAGDLRARMRIVEGEMWASAMRTVRAGGASIT